MANHPPSESMTNGARLEASATALYPTGPIPGLGRLPGQAGPGLGRDLS